MGVEFMTGQTDITSTEILNGNELIVQGALEAGFSLYTGYPGSPLADYFNILYSKKEQLKKDGIKVAIANSEANAAAMASGAKQAGRDCIVAMKSMGLHVASDALSVGNFANPGKIEKERETGNDLSPGTVVVVGDDPWSMSTSTPADSRYLFKHLHIPFLEPSTPQELKDWVKTALYISKRTSVYQGLLLTTYMAEGGGRVEIGTQKQVDGELTNLDPKDFDLGKNVMVPPNSLRADQTMILERFPRVREVLEELALDREFGNSGSQIGFLSTGAVFETLKQTLEETKLIEEVSLYKIACSYPLAESLILPFLKKVKKLVIVEEKRGFLEQQIIELCQKENIKIEVFGKKFGEGEGFPAHGGLSYEIILEKVGKLNLGSTPCGQSPEVLNMGIDLPKRLPTFCPGCPHRETLSLLKDLRKDLKAKGIDLITHGDVGCYSLSFLPPFKEMHNLSAMGQGGALGAGVDFFTENPSVTLMGDSTFFHSGLTDISNSAQSGHNITYIILDNDNTAMTGHQVTPSSGISVEGEVRPKQNIMGVARSLGADYVTEVNPSDRYFYKNLLDEVIAKKGVKVIVSNKECALTFHGRQKSIDRKKFSKDQTIPVKNFYQINTSSCEDCRACVEMTGCPGLTQTLDAYGTKVSIDPQICVGDSYCTKIKVCPSFELVEVFDYHPTKYSKTKELECVEEINLPRIHKSFDDLASGKDLRVVVTGVGGSGVTTISRVLAEAAKSMGGRSDLDFKFVDQKGLAQRNGNVTAHLSIFKKGKSYGAVTPEATADLLLSPDLLDGSAHLRFLGSEGECLIDNEFQTPLSIILNKEEEEKNISRNDLEKKIKEKLGDQVKTLSFKKSCFEKLGKSVYASAAVLGAAFQSGKLPFSLEDMKSSFGKTMKKGEVENNWFAFNLGRSLYVNSADSVDSVDTKESLKVNDLVESLKSSFLFGAKESVADFKSKLEALKALYPQLSEVFLAQYLHDIYLYDRGEKINEFMADAKNISESYDLELQEIALRTLAKTYWIKDEVFVSHILAGPIKEKRDKREYGELGSSYKVSHINRPHFDLFGQSIEFDINPPPWLLKIMRHMRILRRVLTNWHSKEKEIALKVRNEILNTKLDYTRLKKLENIKGYREVRYENAKRVLN